ncbi:MAG TPA: NAD(+) synthase [Azospirillaceae bacterium]|nr:NAD(+) synthase [Azospirillaceae bacterium]
MTMVNGRLAFGPGVLAIDAAAVARDIEQSIVRLVGRSLNRRGVVVGVSGGVDSAVCATLVARALGPDRVLALMMPEAGISDDGTRRAQNLCARLGLQPLTEDITAALTGLGCYRRRDAAIRRVFPDYQTDWKHKIALAGGLMDEDRVSYFNLTVELASGERRTVRMPVEIYLEVVAATNMKQRVRKLIEYHHAERLNYAVIGTPNRLEYELGFFVRGGDGLADLKPIAHLYKTQVYALAEFLGVPEDIRSQPPSTDTYSLDQTQEEFYFGLPFDRLDRLLWAFDHAVELTEAARPEGLTSEQVERVYRDIARKRRVAARSLRDALLIEPVDMVTEAP